MSPARGRDCCARKTELGPITSALAMGNAQASPLRANRFEQREYTLGVLSWCFRLLAALPTEGAMAVFLRRGRVMWQTARRGSVTAAFLAGTSLIACVHGSPTAGAASGTTPGTAGETSPANTNPSNSGVQGQGGSGADSEATTTSGRGSLMPCSSTLPYTSLPCLPLKR